MGGLGGFMILQTYIISFLLFAIIKRTIIHLVRYKLGFLSVTRFTIICNIKCFDHFDGSFQELNYQVKIFFGHIHLTYKNYR